MGLDFQNPLLEPSAVPRVKPEGEPYARRNRGSIGKWIFDYYGNKYDSPRPVPRCPTPACQENYNHGRNGTVQKLLNGLATPRPNTAPPRIKAEGAPIASLSRGKRMKTIINEFAKSAPSPRIPRVKPEAENTATLHKGWRMDKIVHRDSELPLSARPAPRVKPEGEDNADLDKGKRMNTLLHSPAKIPITKAIPRVKSEAEGNYELDRGKRMEKTIHNYGNQTPSNRAIPRVKDEGDPNYKLDQGGRMCRLMHEIRKIPPSPRMPPRVRSPEATSIYRKSQGQVGKLFNNLGQKSFVIKPGVQTRSFSRQETI